MIYFIMIAQLDENSNPIRALKFGYSSNWKQRRETYNNYFYNIKVLKTYEDGTLEDEAKLTEYFKDYVLFGKEWLQYSEDVVNFFMTNDTLDKLRYSLRDVIYPAKSGTRMLSVDRDLIRVIMENTRDLEKMDIYKLEELEREIYEDLCHYAPLDQLLQACRIYELQPDQLEEALFERKSYIEENFNPDTIKFAERFNSLKHFELKIKLLMEFMRRLDLSDSDKNNIFYLIPDKYYTYINVVGIDRIGACKYHEAEVKRELINIYGDGRIEDDVKSEIFKTFEVGNRYSRSGIKSTLRDIYDELGYSKSPKATDLTKYFIVKPLMISNSNGKWVNGLEILEMK